MCIDKVIDNIIVDINQHFSKFGIENYHLHVAKDEEFRCIMINISNSNKLKLGNFIIMKNYIMDKYYGYVSEFFVIDKYSIFNIYMNDDSNIRVNKINKIVQKF